MSAYRDRTPSHFRLLTARREIAPVASFGIGATIILAALPALVLASPTPPLDDHSRLSEAPLPEQRIGADSSRTSVMSTAGSSETRTPVAWWLLEWSAPQSDEGGANEGDTPPGR